MFDALRPYRKGRSVRSGGSARSGTGRERRRTAPARATVLFAVLAVCALPLASDATSTDATSTGPTDTRAPERPRTARFPAVESELHSLVEQVRNDSGFTVDPRNGRAPTRGYVVGTGTGAHAEPASVFFGGEGGAAGERVLKRYLRKHSARLASHRDLHVGAWYDRPNQRVVLSVVQLVADRDEAIRLGVEHHQKAVYDLANRRDVLTGSSGFRRS